MRSERHAEDRDERLPLHAGNQARASYNKAEEDCHCCPELPTPPTDHASIIHLTRIVGKHYLRVVMAKSVAEIVTSSRIALGLPSMATRFAAVDQGLYRELKG